MMLFGLVAPMIAEGSAGGPFRCRHNYDTADSEYQYEPQLLGRFTTHLCRTENCDYTLPFRASYSTEWTVSCAECYYCGSFGSRVGYMPDTNYGECSGCVCTSHAICGSLESVEPLQGCSSTIQITRVSGGWGGGDPYLCPASLRCIHCRPRGEGNFTPAAWGGRRGWCCDAYAHPYRNAYCFFTHSPTLLGGEPLYEYAYLSNMTYSKVAILGLIDNLLGWTALPSSSWPLPPPSGGFYGQLFNKSGTLVLAIRGTNGFLDLVTADFSLARSALLVMLGPT